VTTRTGEKIGWIGGWLGGFVWVIILAGVLLAQGKWTQGVSGLGVAGVAVAAIIWLAPWRHPKTAYWRLMLPLHIMLLVSAVWAIWAYGGWQNAGLSWWSGLWMLPLLIPFGSIGRRRWTDYEG
jgi:hypothetical protein